MELQLGNVQETMLIPLACRANESLRKNARIYDDMAVAIAKQLHLDLQKYDAFLSHEGVISRTILFDRTLKSYLEQYPDAVCVNLGCGLDARFMRVDNGKLTWYDLDLPDALSVKKRFFQETDRYHMLAGSVLDPDWIKELPKNNVTIFIAEGLFMYFTLEQIRQILTSISSAFPAFAILIETNHPFMVNQGKHHDTVKKTNAEFRSGTKSGKELEALCPSIKMVSETSFNEIMKHDSLRGWLFGTIPGLRNFNDRLAVYESPGFGA